MFETKEAIGKILFIISCFICIFMIFSPLANSLFHIDEFFTLSLIKYSITNAITITSYDVHPPLYYIILKIVTKILTLLNINFNTIFVMKMMSVIPYILILIISLTKIKKEYGWLTAGLMSFTVVAMPEFFYKYLFIRMYSWALFFILISFVYLKDVITKSDMKSWIIFTALTICCAYTHYFAALSSVIIYLILFVYILLNKNIDYDRFSELKKWVISVIVIFISYIPWGLILLNQISRVHQSFWVEPVTFITIMDSLSYFMIPITCDDTLKIFSIIILFVLVGSIIYYYKNLNEKDNIYIVFGIFASFGTVLALIILSLTYKPVLLHRYLIPVIAVFWFSISIFISKIEEKRLFAILLTLVLIMGSCSLFYSFEEAQNLSEIGSNNCKFIDGINNNDSVIIVDEIEIMQFGPNLNHAKIYTNADSVNGVSFEDMKDVMDIHKLKDINQVVEENKDKKIYIILHKKRSNLKCDIPKNNIYYIGLNNFYELDI